MKKLLLPVLSLCVLSGFSQWQSTTNYSGKDIYYAFGKVLESDVNSSGLTASSDDGSTWSSSNIGVPSSGLNFGTYNSGTLYGFKDNTIYQTASGNGWALMASATTTADAVKSMAAINGTVLAASDPVSGPGYKIWYLNGSSWALKSSSANGLLTCIRNLNGTLWAGTTNTCVMMSNDGGMTFTNSSVGMTTTSGSEKYINCLASISTTLFAGSHMGKIYRSTNNGVSWNVAYNIGNGSTTIDINDFFIAPNGSVLVACDSGFVYSVDNGSTWTKYNAGLNYSSYENQLTHITMSPNYILATTKRSNGSVVRLPISQTAIGIRETSMPQVESKVYPNPAHQSAIIEASLLTFEDNCEVKINDALGREVGVYPMHNGQLKLDLSGFGPGLYTFSILTNKAMVSKGKLMVN